MRIRHFQHPHDAAEIIGFLPDLYESNFPGFVADTEFIARKRGQLRGASRDPGQIVLVAEDELSICGFIWLIIEIENSGRRRGEVSAVHVARRARGQGLGRQLMQEGETILAQYGCETVQLMVTAANAVAVGLYESLGYGVTRYQMEKPLRRGR